MWQPEWEASLGENKWIYVYDWIPSLSTQNCHSIVNWIYSNTKLKVYITKKENMVSEKVNWMSIKDVVYSPPAKTKLIKFQEALVMGKIWTLQALNPQRFLEVLKSHVTQSPVVNESKLQSWESSLFLWWKKRKSLMVP